MKYDYFVVVYLSIFDNLNSVKSQLKLLVLSGWSSNIEKNIKRKFKVFSSKQVYFQHVVVWIFAVLLVGFFQSG